MKRERTKDEKELKITGVGYQNWTGTEESTEHTKLKYYLD